MHIWWLYFSFLEMFGSKYAVASLPVVREPGAWDTYWFDTSAHLVGDGRALFGFLEFRYIYGSNTEVTIRNTGGQMHCLVWIYSLFHYRRLCSDCDVFVCFEPYFFLCQVMGGGGRGARSLGLHISKAPDRDTWLMAIGMSTNSRPITKLSRALRDRLHRNDTRARE